MVSPRAAASIPASQHTPVWASNPGVPVIARVLAYLFAAMMLYAFVANFVFERDPDLPRMPTTWATLEAGSGCTLIYPDGWVNEKHQEKGSSHIQYRFGLFPGSAVHVDVLLIELPAESDMRMLQHISLNLEQSLRNQFPGFMPVAPRSTARTAGKQFICRDPDRGIPVMGAWSIRGTGSRALCFVAFAPTAGWKTQEVILDRMAAGAVCK